MQYSQEHLKTMVYAKFENSMRENGQKAIKEFHIPFFYIYFNESF